MFEQFIAMQTYYLGKELTVPLWEIIAFVAVITLFLIFGKHRLGLIISYITVFFWVFIVNYNNFFDMLNSTSYGLSAYAVSAIAMLIMTVVGALTGHKES